MEPTDLVYIDEYGLRGTNFYWHKYEAKGLRKQDILEAGLTSDRVQVHKDIIEPLVACNKQAAERGYTLFVKEGYRSRALYEIIYQRRVEKFGKEETDSLFNMQDMPHASGHSVDIAVWDPETDTEVYLRDGADGTDALFVDFYKDKCGENEDAKRYQELQEWLISIMQEHGFRLGTKREYFHFDYRPDTPRNYPLVQTIKQTMKLGHIGIPVKDLEASKPFYDAITPLLGLECINRGETNNVRYGEEGSTRLYIHTRQPALTHLHLCFDVPSRGAVDAFYAAALENGGTDHGAPGVREDYSPTYYAAFVLDPDGNNLEAVCRE